MRIRVDPDRCQGHSRCYAVAPDLFDIDDFGNSTVRHDGLVPDERVEAARLAIQNCPEHAIEIIAG
jgi:ferredoxin